MPLLAIPLTQNVIVTDPLDVALVWSTATPEVLVTAETPDWLIDPLKYPVTVAPATGSPQSKRQAPPRATGSEF